MTQETLAQRLWLAAQTDAGLLVTLRANYSDRHDVLDALWWRSRPHMTASGRRNPADELAELKAHVYSRGCLAEPVVDSWDPVSAQTVTATAHEHRLRTLSTQLIQDSNALDALLARMRDWTPETVLAVSSQVRPVTVGFSRPTPTKPMATSVRAQTPAREPAAQPVLVSPPGLGSGTSAGAEPALPVEPPVAASPRLDSAAGRLTPRNGPVLFALGMLAGLILGVSATLGSFGWADSPGPGKAASAANEQGRRACPGASRRTPGPRRGKILRHPLDSRSAVKRLQASPTDNLHTRRPPPSQPPRSGEQARPAALSAGP